MPKITTPLQFLQWFRPEGPWFLSAVIPDGKMETCRFEKGEGDALTDWVKVRDGKKNLYFALNTARWSGPGAGRP